MAKIIEFIGPSGIGKTTTYNLLCDMWSSQSCWIPYNKCETPMIYPVENSFKSRIKAHIFGNKALPYPDPKFLIAKRDKFIAENPEFMDALWTSIANWKDQSGVQDERLVLINFAMELIAKNQVIKDYTKSKYGIMEEGICHNLGFVTDLNSPVSIQEQIQKLLNKTNFVDIVFSFEADAAIVFDRLLKRKDLCVLDKNLNDEQIFERCKYIIEQIRVHTEILTQNNIQVYTIDANQSAKKNAAKIKDILDKLE